MFTRSYKCSDIKSNTKWRRVLQCIFFSSICFKRLPVEVHNASVLISLPASNLTFECVDTGITKSLDKSADATFTLKPGCKVMLIYNINDHLKNGTCGEFKGVAHDKEGLMVDFPKVGTIEIHRRIWYKYDTAGKVQGSRTQFPLTLCYAITAHRSQGLTLDRIVVHCSTEFIPGQTYVAISRVRHEGLCTRISFAFSFAPTVVTRRVKHMHTGRVPPFILLLQKIRTG